MQKEAMYWSKIDAIIDQYIGLFLYQGGMQCKKRPMYWSKIDAIILAGEKFHTSEFIR